MPCESDEPTANTLRPAREQAEPVVDGAGAVALPARVVENSTSVNLVSQSDDERREPGRRVVADVAEVVRRAARVVDDHDRCLGPRAHGVEHPGWRERLERRVGAAAVGNVCHRGAPALTSVGSGVSGNTPMCPQISNDVSSIEPNARRELLDPEAARSRARSPPTHSWSLRTGNSTPSATAWRDLVVALSPESFDRHVWT